MCGGLADASSKYAGKRPPQTMWVPLFILPLCTTQKYYLFYCILVHFTFRAEKPKQSLEKAYLLPLILIVPDLLVNL